MKLAGLQLVAAVASVVVATSADAVTRRVPSEYATIQAGIDAAVVSDTVLVAPGTYVDYTTRGNSTACVFPKSGVALLSEGGSAVTEIHMPNGSGQPYLIFGNIGPATTTAIGGFTLTSVPLNGSGAWVFGPGKVTFRDCVFRDLVGFITNAGLNVNNSDVDVIGCQFINCQTSGGPGLGAGIYQDDGRIEVRDSYFEDCDARAIFVVEDDTGSEALIENCEFVNCRGPNGGCLSVFARPGGTTIRRCTFVGNVDAGTGGGALGLSGLGSALVEECVFLFNQTIGTNGLGGAVKSSKVTTIRRCTFVGNHQIVVADGGAAIAFPLLFSSGSHVESNIIYGSTGSAAVSGRIGAVLVSACNVFWANEGGNAGVGYALAPTDREVDPLFCDVVGGDYTLFGTSPCLPENSAGCGAIGLFGEGCGVVSVDPATWTKLKAAYR